MNFLSTLYWRFLASPEMYARHLGVTIGENCLIGTRCWSSEPYLITIGNNVQITENVRFYTYGGGNVARRKYPKFDAFGKIVIEDWAYVGAGSLIMPGVTIGEGALIGAGSVVTKSVAKGTVVAGNPARYICLVDEYIERNLRYNIDTKGLALQAKREILKTLDSEKFIKK